MDSKLAGALRTKYAPVAVMLTDERPTEALQFKENIWGCVAAMLNGAARGKTVVFDRKTFGCQGGGVGLGFGDQYVNFPGGIENFLSTGNKDFCSTDMGKNIVRNMPALEHGERYFKDPGTAKKFVDALPYKDVPAEYVVFKPLGQVAESEQPQSVVFLVNPDQLTALVVMSNYARGNGDNVLLRFGAGCHQIGLFPYQEAESETPRAVIGLTDISVRKQFDKDILSFTVPYKMFLEMESNVEGSFLENELWQKLLERNK